MNAVRPLLITCIAALLFVSSGVHAQEVLPIPIEGAPPILRVAIKPLAPFVIYEGDAQVGFSIDLWTEIAARIGVETQYVRVETVGEQIAAIDNGEADAAIAGITITAAREMTIDFSMPMFDAGLQIMTRPGGTLTLADTLSLFLSSSIVQVIGILVVVILVAANIVWWVERHNNPEFPRRYRDGLVEGVCWAAVTLGTAGNGDKTPKSPIGRVIAIVWMFIGITLIAQFTAIITSSFTTRELRGSINSPDDLYGRRIVTVAGSTAQTYLVGRGIHAETVTSIIDAYPLLQNEEIDAIVYDSPVLFSYSNRDGRGSTKVVEGIFDPEYYGIALTEGSPWREAINRALLAMQESGVYQTIYERWFGRL